MKYFILIIAFLFIGCDTGRMEKLDKINIFMDTWCDTSTGIVYLLYESGNQAGLTAYLDEEGKPQRCKKEALK